MPEWFARPVLHVSNVEASLRLYVDRLGFRVPWRVEDADENKGRWGYRLLVVEDPDGNEPFFNYPNEPGRDPEGLRRT